MLITALVLSILLTCFFAGLEVAFISANKLGIELKKKQGKHFDLKKFHEQFLSYGSAPVKYIRELMLAESE